MLIVHSNGCFSFFISIDNFFSLRPVGTRGNPSDMGKEIV